MLFGYLFMCMIFGTTFLAIKIGVEGGIPPFWFAGVRFLLAGILVLIVLRGFDPIRTMSRGTLWEIFVGRESLRVTRAGTRM